MTHPEPALPWPAFLLATWPVWAGVVVVVVLAYVDQVAAGVARILEVVRCPACGAWRVAGRPCSTSRGCPS